MRKAWALVVGVVVAGVASLFIGEYGVAGWVTLFVGTITGLVMGEVVASVGHSRSWVLAVGAAALAGVGVWWGAYLDSGRGVAPLGWEGVVAPLLGAAIAAIAVRTYRVPPKPVDPVPDPSQKD